jgi:hypothetical protein
VEEIALVNTRTSAAKRPARRGRCRKKVVYMSLP